MAGYQFTIWLKPEPEEKKVTFAMTDELHEEVKEMAKKKNMTIDETIKFALLQCYDKALS